MSYHALRSLGDSNPIPWHEASADTLQLQASTNEALQAAGYCHIPSTGILDGTLCGARNFLTLNSVKLFGKTVNYPLPSDCAGHEAEWSNPTHGCFQHKGLPFSKSEWILMGGAVSALLAVYLLVKGKKSSGAKSA